MAVVTTGVCISLLSCIAACLQCCWRPCFLSISALAGVNAIAYAPASAVINSVVESPTVDAVPAVAGFPVVASGFVFAVLHYSTLHYGTFFKNKEYTTELLVVLFSD